MPDPGGGGHGVLGETVGDDHLAADQLPIGPDVLDQELAVVDDEL
jgi:hypothetical protein